MRIFQLLEATSNRFILHPNLPPENYKMTNSLGQVDKWKAYIYTNNNGYDQEIGEFGDVGYVMISLSDNTIIPIARADEHHMGMELLHDLRKKYRITGEYYPIFPYSTYFNDERDKEKITIALTKYLQYRGNDGLMFVYTEGDKVVHYSPNQKMMHYSDFVKNPDMFKAFKKELAPIGQKFYDNVKLLSDLVIAIGQNPDRIQSKKAFDQAKVLLKYTISANRAFRVDSDKLSGYMNKLSEAIKENDVRSLEKMFFGFDGLKNVIHKEMKKIASDKNAWGFKDLQATWGDIDYAISLLAEL